MLAYDHLLITIRERVWVVVCVSVSLFLISSSISRYLYNFLLSEAVSFSFH